MYVDELPDKIEVGVELKEDDDWVRVKYIEEKGRLKGIRIHYNENHYLYALSEGFDSKEGSSLILLDKRPSDEKGIDNEIPLDGIQLLELVKTDYGYVEFIICYLEIEDFHDYLLDNFTPAIKIICEVGKEHYLQVYKEVK